MRRSFSIPVVGMSIAGFIVMARAQTPPAPAFASRVVVDNDKVRIQRLTVPGGFREPLQVVPNDQIAIQVTPADLEVTINGQKTAGRIEPGTTFYVPTNAPHQFLNMGKAPYDVVVVSLASAGQAATATGCDRECLRGKVTQLLHALVKHDVSGLPVADALRVTEDAVEKPLAKVGLVGTVTRLRGYRQDIIDERAGVAAAQVMVEETGAPVMLVVRLKVVADKLTEVELVATRSRSEGLIFNIDGLSAPSAVMNYAPRPSQLPTRDDAIKAALKYPEGLNSAKTFAAVNAPFAPDAYRYENGQLMAGPDCKFAPGCQNISTQSLAIFERLGDVQTRVIAVDERMGIVLLRMAWGVRERGGDQLTVWEAFKVFDGQLHAVEAFMRILPVEKRNGGWQ